MNKVTEQTNQKIIKAKQPAKQIILVVDDCIDTLLLNRTVLELEGFEVFTAQSGSDAMSILKQISFPDLILLDMKMEEMSGLEFLNKLEKERPEIVANVPVVFMTGVDHVPPSKASGFIQKPVEISYFVKAVRQYIKAHGSFCIRN